MFEFGSLIYLRVSKNRKASTAIVKRRMESAIGERMLFREISRIVERNDWSP